MMLFLALSGFIILVSLTLLYIGIAGAVLSDSPNAENSDNE